VLATTSCVALLGAEARLITVEVDVMAQGLPGVKVVGMASRSVNEAAQRIRSAIQASGHRWPQRKIVANLAPGALRKDGTHFDLPLALGILAAFDDTTDLEIEALRGWVCIGELALDGSLRPVPGALAAAMAAEHHGARGLICPTKNAAEGALVDGADVVAVSSLAQAVGVLAGKAMPDAIPEPSREPEDAGPDLLDVRGQRNAKRALEIAAAGAHNVLMVGAPGGGKTMLARRLPGILPRMSREESLEVTRLYSVAGRLGDDASLLTERPFRSPHHNTSVAGLIGGGSGLPRPGEAVLAHGGVLFLDELSLFRRDALEALRGPLEDREVRIARADAAVTFPCCFSLVAAMNPCPCGYLGNVRRGCRCSDGALAAHRARVSGPLLDRFDLVIGIEPVDKDDLLGPSDGESSAVVRARVEQARGVQSERYGSAGTTNSNGPQDVVEEVVRLSRSVRARIGRAIEEELLSARGMVRTLRVARTIADLAGSDAVLDQHVADALAFRPPAPTIAVVA
jgi:magnesium chelatase family protein